MHIQRQFEAASPFLLKFLPLFEPAISSTCPSWSRS